MEFSNWIVLAGAVIGAVITIIQGFKKFHRSVILPAQRHFARVDQLMTDVAEMKLKISKELTPNGGSSLLDQVRAFGKSLSRLEGLQLAILSNSDSGVWISDEKGLCVWVNQWLSEKLEWLPSDLYGNGWKNTVAPHDRDRVFKEFESCVKDGRNFMASYSLIHKRDDSISILVEALCYPIRKADGEIIGHAGFLKPIDE